MSDDDYEVRAREHQGRLLDAVASTDVFRVVVRGFGIFEDILEIRINEMLKEPLNDLGASPFSRKLGLAVALGLISTDDRPAFAALATLRHRLAHADRDPESVTAAELREIYSKLDRNGSLEVRGQAVGDNVGYLAGIAIVAALVTVEVGAKVARERREAAQAALQNQMRASALSREVIEKLLGGAKDFAPDPE